MDPATVAATMKNADKYLAMLHTLRLWAVLLMIGVAAPGAAYFGFDIPMSQAILILCGFTGVAVVVRYFPPPETKSPPPPIAISPEQIAFCSQFVNWTPFEDAARAPGPDDRLRVSEARQKIKELRVEVGTVQKLLHREIRDGRHFVRFHRADDKTTFTPQQNG